MSEPSATESEVKVANEPCVHTVLETIVGDRNISTGVLEKSGEKVALLRNRLENLELL